MRESERFVIYVISTTPCITYTGEPPEGAPNNETKALWLTVHSLDLRIIYEDGWVHDNGRSQALQREMPITKSDQQGVIGVENSVLREYFAILNLECLETGGFKVECEEVLQQLAVVTVNLLGPSNYKVSLIHPTTEEMVYFELGDETPLSEEMCH